MRGGRRAFRVSENDESVDEEPEDRTHADRQRIREAELVRPWATSDATRI